MLLFWFINNNTAEHTSRFHFKTPNKNFKINWWSLVYNILKFYPQRFWHVDANDLTLISDSNPNRDYTARRPWWKTTKSNFFFFFVYCIHIIHYFHPKYRGLLKESTSTLRVNVLNSSFHPVLVNLQPSGDVELVKLSGHMTAGNSNSMHIIVLLDDPGPRHGPGWSALRQGHASSQIVFVLIKCVVEVRRVTFNMNVALRASAPLSDGGPGILLVRFSINNQSLPIEGKYQNVVVESKHRMSPL